MKSKEQQHLQATGRWSGRATLEGAGLGWSRGFFGFTNKRFKVGKPVKLSAGVGQIEAAASQGKRREDGCNKNIEILCTKACQQQV